MKRFLALCILVFVGVATWQIGSKLSADALGMGVGVVLGVMTATPMAMLLFARRPLRSVSPRDIGALYAPPVVIPPQPKQLPLRNVELIDPSTGKRIVAHMRVLEQSR